MKTSTGKITITFIISMFILVGFIANAQVSVLISPSRNPICFGSTVQFTATPTNGGTNPTYQWQVNGVNAGTNTPVYSYIPSNNDKVLCILTSSIPNIPGNPATSNTVTMFVSGMLVPEVAIAAGVNPSCAGTLVTFTATPTNGGSTPSYQWKVNNVNSGTNSPNLSYIPVNGDVITCVMT